VEIRLVSWFSIAFNRNLQRFSWPDPPQLTNHLVFGRAEQICMKNSYNENKVIPGKSSRRRKPHLIDLLLNNLMSFKTQMSRKRVVSKQLQLQEIPEGRTINSIFLWKALKDTRNSLELPNRFYSKSLQRAQFSWPAADIGRIGEVWMIENTINAGTVHANKGVVTSAVDP
jgi:hypothetical protein